MVTIPEAPLLSCGKAIPLVGFGTAEFPFSSNEDIKESVLHAIKVGYRHFDTAALYRTEQPLGEAIAEGLRLGIIKSRDELFITSKLWPSNAHQHLVLPALQDSLKYCISNLIIIIYYFLLLLCYFKCSFKS